MVNFIKNAFTSSVQCVGIVGILAPLLLGASVAQAQVLAAPTDFYVYEGLGEGTESGFELRWTDNAVGEDAYVLERSVDGVSFATDQTLPADAYKASAGLPVGSLQSFRVRAKKGSSFSAPSNVLTFTSVWGPIYFSVATTDPSSATIKFNDRSEKETGYVIERSSDGGATYQTVVRQPTASFGANKAKVYVDTNGGAGLAAGVRYRYRVAAYDAVGNSPYARPGYISVAPGMIPNVPGIATHLTADSANGLTPGVVRITLRDNSNNEKRTEVQRSTDKLNWLAIGGISATAGEPITTDRRGDIQPNATYYYRAYATNDIGPSGYSEIVEVRVPVAPPSGVTSWYVWRGATGTPSGESWQNAWRNVSDINWVAVKPGHTVYLSGDDYQRELAIFSSGTQGSPVKIRSGALAPQALGHQGAVLLSNIYFGPRVNWVSIDGARSSTFQAASALEVPGNINIYARNSPKHGVFSSSPVGISLRYVGVEDATDAGIALVGLPSEDLEVFACHVKTTGGVGISFGYPSARPVYDAFKLQKTLIEYTGDDAIQSSGNITISDNIVRYNNPDSAGHADVIQSVGGNYFKIYNNAFYDRTKSSYFFTSGSARSGVSGHWHLYNNLFYYTDPALVPGTAIILFSAQNDFEPGLAFLPEVTYSDIVIANNTFVSLGNNRVLNFTKRDAQVGSVRVTDLTFVNNIMVDTGGLALKGDPASGYSFDETQLRVSNNVMLGGDIFYKGQYYSVQQFNQLLGVTTNVSLAPSFVDRARQNFHLTASDVVARNKGISLSSLFGFDFDGALRPSTAAWDIGAFEQGATRSAQPMAPGLLRAQPLP